MNEFTYKEVFLVSEIIDKMEIKADVEAITKGIKIKSVEGSKDVTELGKEVLVGIAIDMFTKAAQKMHKAEKEITKLIVRLTGKTEEEVNKMSIKQMKELYEEVSKNTGLDDFLSQAGESIEAK